MKQLLIIRHAKSSWDFSNMNDFDRPLNERGHNDAPMMAKRLVQKNIAIDAFVSSTAKRAFTTAYYFANEYKLKEKDIIQVGELYHAPSNVFYNVIQHFSNQHNTVAIFSHNPGITEFVNELTEMKIIDMPTCGIFAIKIHTNNWEEFETAKKEVLFFDYPKAV
jgi:phosphohistidine phosphatase